MLKKIAKQGTSNMGDYLKASYEIGETMHDAKKGDVVKFADGRVGIVAKNTGNNIHLSATFKDGKASYLPKCMDMMSNRPLWRKTPNEIVDVYAKLQSRNGSLFTFIKQLLK